MFTILQNLLTSTTINTIFIITMMQSARVVDNLISSLVKYCCLFKTLLDILLANLYFLYLHEHGFIWYIFLKEFILLWLLFFFCYPVSWCINISMQCTIKIPFKVRRLFNIYLPLLKNLRHYKCSIFYLHTIFSLLFERQCISNQQKYRAHLTRRLAGNLFCFVCFPWRFSRCFQIIWHCQQNLEPFSNLLTSIFF